MGYIITEESVDLNKAVISLWFRIPQASYDIAFGRTPDPVILPVPSPEFHGAIPIISFGPQYSVVNGPTSSSWIGVCYNNASSPVWGGGTFGLAFNLQFDTTGSRPPEYGTGVPENIMMGVTYNALTTFVFPKPIPVSADKWHHLLISWDINGMSTRPFPGTGGDYSSVIGGGSTVYVALDNKNLVGQPDPPSENIFWPCGGYFGGNGFITVSAFLVAQESIDHIPQPSFGWGGGPLPSSPFGLPTAGKINFNEAVELAEFQLFAGTSMDTADTSVRHMFITSSGKPVPPGGTGTQRLSRDPDILLHGVGNWKQGRNTGALDALQFQHFGTINKFKPEPEIGK